MCQELIYPRDGMLITSWTQPPMEACVFFFFLNDAVRKIWNFINYLLKIYGAVVKGDAAPSLTFLSHTQAANCCEQSPSNFNSSYWLGTSIIWQDILILWAKCLSLIIVMIMWAALVLSVCYNMFHLVLFTICFYHMVCRQARNWNKTCWILCPCSFSFRGSYTP